VDKFYMTDFLLFLDGAYGSIASSPCFTAWR